MAGFDRGVRPIGFWSTWITLSHWSTPSTRADILDMPISEAAEFFKAYPAISRYLDTLVQVGLGYIPAWVI